MKKGNLKYSPLVASNIGHGEVLLPGRRPCNCEATKHALINNCIHCGRIVCEQEKSGPCFTCNNLVCTPKEQDVIGRMSKAGYKLYNKLMNQEQESEEKKEDLKPTGLQSNDSLQNALQHRDRLLKSDQTIEKRTKVIDDQSDYFQTDSNWLSKKEKALLSKKKEAIFDAMHGSKKNTVTFDFGQKRVIEEKPVINYNVEDLLQSDVSIFECNTPVITADYLPKYEESEENKTNRYSTQSESSQLLFNKLKNIRIQDRELQEMSDEGKCLSMHQPYASLLVKGIKKHEGRMWYTSYRGRLWIHSAAKVPSTKEILDLENFYKQVSEKSEFPTTYPTGCLLGCADLVDCLPQEEYKSQFPNGEIASPYVFIFENPCDLNLKFPMLGKHKIFKLESNIHQAAKKTLKKLLS